VTDKEKLRFYSAIGENIKKAREDAGIKQAAFGTMLGLSRASIVNIEKGRQHPPLHLLWDMTKKLKINLPDLLSDIESQKRSQSEIKHIEKQISELLKDESESSKEKVAQFITENING
jgi:transcriptional regulator with XRE-family HTH domain